MAAAPLPAAVPLPVAPRHHRGQSRESRSTAPAHCGTALTSRGGRGGGTGSVHPPSVGVAAVRRFVGAWLLRAAWYGPSVQLQPPCHSPASGLSCEKISRPAPVPSQTTDTVLSYQDLDQCKAQTLILPTEIRECKATSSVCLNAAIVSLRQCYALWVSLSLHLASSTPPVEVFRNPRKYTKKGLMMRSDVFPGLPSLFLWGTDGSSTTARLKLEVSLWLLPALLQQGHPEQGAQHHLPAALLAELHEVPPAHCSSLARFPWLAGSRTPIRDVLHCWDLFHGPPMDTPTAPCLPY